MTLLTSSSVPIEANQNWQLSGHSGFSGLSSSKSNFFHLSWAASLKSDLLMVGVAHGRLFGGFC